MHRITVPRLSMFSNSRNKDNRRNSNNNSSNNYSSDSGALKELQKKLEKTLEDNRRLKETVSDQEDKIDSFRKDQEARLSWEKYKTAGKYALGAAAVGGLGYGAYKLHKKIKEDRKRRLEDDLLLEEYKDSEYFNKTKK